MWWSGFLGGTLGMGFSTPFMLGRMHTDTPSTWLDVLLISLACGLAGMLLGEGVGAITPLKQKRSLPNTQHDILQENVCPPPPVVRVDAKRKKG